MAKIPDKPFDDPLRGRCGQRVNNPQVGATALCLLGIWQSRRFRPLLRLTSLVIIQAFLASNVVWAGGPAGLGNLRNQASQENRVASGLEERLGEPTHKQAPSNAIPQPLAAQAPTFWQVRGNEAPGAVQLGGLEEGSKAARPGALAGWKKWASIATLLFGSYVSPAIGQDAAKPVPTLQPPAAVMVQKEAVPARPSLPKHLQTFAPVMGERLTVFYVRWYRPHPPSELAELQTHYKDRGVQVNFLYLTDRPVRGTIQELPGGAVKGYQMSFSDFWRTLDTYQATDGRWYERDTRHFPRVVVMDFLGNLAQPDPSQLRTFLDESLQTMERQEEAKRVEAERTEREEQEKTSLQRIQEERQKAQAEVDRLKKEQQDLQKLQEQKKQADQAVKELETKRSTVQEEVQKLQQDQARLAKEAEEARRQLEKLRAEQKQVPAPAVGVQPPTTEVQPPALEAPQPSLPWPWIIVGGAALLAAGYGLGRKEKELASKAKDLASRIRRKAIRGRGVVEAVSVSPTAETEALRQEGARLEQERIRLVGEVEALQRQKEESERQVATLQEEAKVKPAAPAAPPAAAVAPPPPQTLGEAVVAVQTARANLQARIEQDRERLDGLADRLKRVLGQLQEKLEAELDPEAMTVPELEERHRQQAESIRRSALAENRKEELLSRIQRRFDQAREERGRMLEAIRQELEPKVQALADAGSGETFNQQVEELQKEASQRVPDEEERRAILDRFQEDIERHRQAAQDRQRQERERLGQIEAQKQQRIEALQHQLKELEGRFAELQRAEDQEEVNRLAAELDAVSVPEELDEVLRPYLEQASQARALAHERIAQAERERVEQQKDARRRESKELAPPAVTVPTAPEALPPVTEGVPEEAPAPPVAPVGEVGVALREEALQRQLEEFASRFNGLQYVKDQEEFNRLAAELDAVSVPEELAEGLRPYLEQANQARASAQERIAQSESRVQQAKEKLWVSILRGWGIPEEVLQYPEKRRRILEVAKGLKEKEPVMRRLEELNLIAPAAPAEPAAREAVPEEQKPAPPTEVDQPLQQRLKQISLRPEELESLVSVIGRFGELIENDREFASRNAITSDMQYVVALPGQPVRWVAYEKGRWLLFEREGDHAANYPIVGLKRGEPIASPILYLNDLNDRMSAVQVTEGHRVPLLDYLGVPRPRKDFQVVEAGGFILEMGENQFQSLIFPYKGYHLPGFFVHPGDEALRGEGILPDQPLSNQYEAARSAEAPGAVSANRSQSANLGSRIFLGWHSHPEGEPQLGPADEEAIQRAYAGRHFELIFAPKEVALWLYWQDGNEKLRIFSSDTIHWLPSLGQFLQGLANLMPVEVKPVRSQEEFLDRLRAGDANPEDPLRRMVEDHLSPENRFTLKAYREMQIYRPEDDSVLVLGLYKNEVGEDKLGVERIDRSTGAKKREYTWPLPRPGDLHLDLLPTEVITRLQRLGFDQNFLQTVEVGGLVLPRPDGSFFLVELPRRSPHFVLADVDLTKLLRGDQAVHETNMYDWLKKFYDLKEYPAILGIHTQPLSSDPPKLSLEDFKELEDQQEISPVSPWQLVVQPNGVALGTVTLVSREGRLSIQDVHQVAEDQIPQWVRDLPSKIVAAPRSAPGGSGQAQRTGLEEAAGVRPSVAGLLREPRFFTRTAEVPGSIYFFVDTKEDPRTLRLAQLAAMVKAHEGWEIEFSGVARQGELEAAVEELEGDIGSQVILENRILTYVTDAEYLDRRTEALRRLPEGVKVITRVNRETMIWFDEAIQAAGLRYLTEDLKRWVEALLQAA